MASPALVVLQGLMVEAEQKGRIVDDDGVWFPQTMVKEKLDYRIPFLLLFCLQMLGISQVITLFWSQ